MRGRPIRSAAWLVVALALASLAACSTERRLDVETIEAGVFAQLFPEHPGLVSAVNCPELIEPMPGQRFSCATQIGEQIIDVPVVLGGTIEALEATVELDDRFVRAGEIADLLAETFTTEIGISTAVDCGQPVLVLEPGSALLCTAVDTSGAMRQFDVLVAADGTLDLAIR